MADTTFRSGNKLFVETGTYFGETTAAIAAIPGVQIHTIELSRELHGRALARFRHAPNVRCWRGDSLDVLADVLKQVDQPAVFWLDGHWSGGETALGRKACPALEELFAILSRPNPGHTLLINDMRNFAGGEYPKAALVEELIRHYWPSYSVSIIVDVMRAVPPDFGVSAPS